VSGAAVVLLALLAAPAAAAPVAAPEEGTPETKEEARQIYQAAEAHFQRGSFPEALSEYEAGYKLTRLPGFLINIAQCHRLMGELKKARAFYRKYLLVMPVSPRRQEVEEMILALDKAIAEGAAAPTGTAAAPPAKPEKPSAPERAASVRWWIWSAVAGSVVGSTVATSTLAAASR
jgi:tetratricopeptide (TPR) repeat protein